MGPLAGMRIVEFAGIGPGPMCAMLLADLGASVLRIDRPGASGLGLQRPPEQDVLLRGRKAIRLDLKNPAAVTVALDLIDRAEALIEGFRPGVMERLGLGPETCLARNPRLVYGRMTGWGQHGPLAQAAGHDLNYIALTGTLHAIGRAGQLPAPPLNLIGDFGGGSHYLAIGLLAGIIAARASGRGQVVDAAIVDGTASLMAQFHGLAAGGLQNETRGANILDSGAHFYDVYECVDGGLISLAPIEAKFYAEMLDRLGIDAATMPPQMDRSTWPKCRARIAAVIKTATREEWCRRLEGSDVCFAPVLSLSEAPGHPHMSARDTYVTIGGMVQPAPAPRFSDTVPDVPSAPQAPGCPEEVLAGWLPADHIAAARHGGSFID